MKIFLRVLFLSLFITSVGIYTVNPFNVTTENIRPRILGHDIYRIPSKSMLTTLAPSDYILISNTAYIEKTPKNGDIIIFNRPSEENPNKSIPFIKRLIASAGDTLQIQKGVVSINGEKLTETYINANNNKRAYSQYQPLIKVPEGMLFVMGDNRDNSKDSRIFGFISQNDLIGQATTIIYGRNGLSWDSLLLKNNQNDLASRANYPTIKIQKKTHTALVKLTNLILELK